MPQRYVGVVVVHGVVPHPRYQIQDEAASALALRLNEENIGGGTWEMDVINPPSAGKSIPSPPKGYEAKSTRVRVHFVPSDPTPGAPAAPANAHDVYDVVEAYWSPLDKNQTNAPSVLSWLLSTIFVPANTSARYMANWTKTCYDILYVLIAAAIGVAASLVSLWIGLASLQHIAALAAIPAATPGKMVGLATLWSILGDPAKIGDLLSIQAVGLLACAFVGGFIGMQFFRAIISLVQQVRDTIPGQVASRIGFIVLLGVQATVLLVIAAFSHLPTGNSMGWWALGFTFAALFFELGRTVFNSFLVNFFGDVQIYTTHDENSQFYELREKILDLVTQTIGDMTSTTATIKTARPTGEMLPKAVAAAPAIHDDEPMPYDRVHVLAHSLGSTIALDALIRLYNLKEQALYGPADFARIRSLVTFGSPLEKTKYFFDINDPSQSLSYVQWRNDAYGVLFTADESALAASNGEQQGIFWRNFWYFLDPIANQIESYRSYLIPTDDLANATAIRDLVAKQMKKDRAELSLGRLVCSNADARGVINIFAGRFIPHGDYLGDPWFWQRSTGPDHGPGPGVLDVVMSKHDTSRGFAPSTQKNDYTHRYQRVKPADAIWHRDVLHEHDV